MNWEIPLSPTPPPVFRVENPVFYTIYLVLLHDELLLVIVVCKLYVNVKIQQFSTLACSLFSPEHHIILHCFGGDSVFQPPPPPPTHTHTHTHTPHCKNYFCHLTEAYIVFM